MSMIHHAGGPGRGVTLNEFYANFFNRSGATAVAVGHILCLDFRGLDLDTVTFTEGGDPSVSQYPNDHIFRNCVLPTLVNEGGGVFVLVTDLKGNGGANDTEFRGCLIGNQVDIMPDTNSPNVVIATSVLISDVSLSTVDSQLVVDAASGGSEKILAIPQEAIANNGSGILTGKAMFNGIEGFGAA